MNQPSVMLHVELYMCVTFTCLCMNLMLIVTWNKVMTAPIDINIQSHLWFFNSAWVLQFVVDSVDSYHLFLGCNILLQAFCIRVFQLMVTKLCFEQGFSRRLTFCNISTNCAICMNLNNLPRNSVLLFSVWLRRVLFMTVAIDTMCMSFLLRLGPACIEM